MDELAVDAERAFVVMTFNRPADSPQFTAETEIFASNGQLIATGHDTGDSIEWDATLLP